VPTRSTPRHTGILPAAGRREGTVSG
jgi:hypothetical protein